MSRPLQAHNRLTQKLDKYFRETLNRKEGGKELVVKDLHFPDPDEKNDLQSQKAAKVEGVSFSRPIKGTLELKKGGKTVDRAKVKLLDLPQVTSRGSYVVDGNEYSFPMQKRLIPGVYTNEKNDGSVESWFNSSKGRNIKVKLRKKGDFVANIGSRKINLLALLVGLGVEKHRIREAWGEEVYQENTQARGAGDPKKALKKTYDQLHHESQPGVPEETVPHLRKWILNYFDENSEFDEDNVEITMNVKADKISPQLMLRATEKILAVKRDDEDEDNRESLIHNHVYDQSDFVLERLQQRQYRYKIDRTLNRNLKKFDKVSKVVQKNLFQTPVESTFTKTSLARIPKQNNPMDQYANHTAITSMGEGGIQSEHAVTRDQRAVDPSHLNFLDPMHTPEGGNLGTSLHVAKGVKKKGKNLVKKVIDIKTGEPKEVTPRQMHTSTTAFSEYYEDGSLTTDEDGKVKAMSKGDIKRVPPSQVDYAMVTTTDMFGVNSIGMPFLSHNNGTRGMTAAKMQAQAKSLVNREPPKVQAAVDEKSDRTVEEVMGEANIPKAPVGGKITKIEEDYLVIKAESGKEHKVQFPKNFWLNEHNFQDTELAVEEGDNVEEGDPLGDSNYTKGGQLALGVNMKTAYTPYKGLNHEDGVVVSETGAEKLTSQHAYQKTVDVHDDEVLDKQKYLSYFPSVYDQDALSKMGDDGVIKKGQEVSKGDPIALKLKEVKEDSLSRKLKNVSRILTQDYRDRSVEWDKTASGTVSEVHHRKEDILVVVKTEEKARVGDKLVGRYGNKGTITKIISDDEMPHDEDDEPLELLLNPNGVVSRMNMGQIMETTASKIAEHDGEPYVARPFGKDHTEEIQKELEERGLKDHSTIYDPVEDEEIEGVLTGDHYTLKLEHKVDKKMTSRGAGPGESYSMSGQPSQGGKGGGRSVGIGEMYAMLAHGAEANLSEMYTFKGDASMEHWRSIENGTMLPPPEMPTSSKKFVTMLRGMGINMQEDDNGMTKMVPFLDEDVREISNGEIEDATALRAKDLKEEDGGLFDYETTGGLEGEQWSHVELAEPMPHPTFEKAIRDVTKLKQKEVDAIMGGEKGVVGGKVVGADKPGAKTGGEGLKSMLSDIDPEERLEEIKEEAKDASGSKLNKMHREARTLKNFKEQDKGLDEMVVDTLPIMPPKFRPIIDLPNGDLNVADVNEHYRATILMNNQMKALDGKKGLSDQKDKVRKSLYDGLKGTMGYSMGLVDQEDVKGISSTIAGKNPKSGYFQKRLMKRRQDTSGTAVVSPDPDLNMDQLGVPEHMAWDIFQPHIKKDLIGQGLTPLNAEEEIEEKTDMAKDSLSRVMDDKHVLANRAPTLHKFSMMAFKPKLVPGHAVKLPVEVLGGFNADFDGDTFGIHVPATAEAEQEAEEMLPSNNLYQAGYGGEQMNPGLSHEYVLGLYKITREGKRTNKRYSTVHEAIKAADDKDVGWTDQVQISGIGTTTPGRARVMKPVPEKFRDYETRLDDDAIHDKLKEIEKKGGKQDYLDVIKKWKEIGKDYAYKSGSSFLISDLQATKSERDRQFRDADRKVEAIRRDPNLSDEEKKEKSIEIYSKADEAVMEKATSIKGNAAGKSNNISDMVDAGARGNPNQVKQLVGTLGLMLDHKQETIEEPVRGNYAEGLSSGDFWSHMPSQRKGMIDKTQSVAGPGYLAKELTNSAAQYTITEKDCGTDQGRREKVDRHIKHRVLAESAAGHTKGAVIDDDVLESLKKSGPDKAKVRSILTCESTKGICATCFGYDETGNFPEIGKNIGISEVQALTERATQLPMKSFHTGGVATAETGLSNAFDRAEQILEMPQNIQGKAELAKTSGTVQEVRESGYGGKTVVIDGVEHKVDQGLDLKVDTGDRVKRGDPISDGVVKPQELMEQKGVDAVQTQMRDDLHETFASAGVDLQKKNHEMAVKMLTEKVRVTDPGDCDEYVPGDYSTLPKVRGWNKRNPGKRPIEFENVLPGAQQNPHKGDDWAQRMTLNRIGQTLQEGGAQGFESPRKDPPPFADLALGPGSEISKPGQEAASDEW